MHILILAAGQGKRMHSRLPKVLHPVLFRPMLHHVLDLAYGLPNSSVSVIVGHGEEQVRAACAEFPALRFFRQTEQKGTAHAVRSAEEFLSTQKDGDVLILSGDVPLLQPSSLQKLLDSHRASNTALSFVTAHVAQPKGYGRVLRDSARRVTGIREEADCNEAERAITEVNAGIYCFRLSSLLSALKRIENRNRQGEFYLTDAIGLLVADSAGVEGVALDDAREMMGVNDRLALAETELVLQERVNRGWMLKGVSIQGPQTVFIDTRTRLEADVRIEAGCQILRSTIAAGAVIEAGSRLTDCVIAADAHVKQGSYLEKSEVGAKSSVGPYAHLRPGSKLAREVKIGNFVEVKNATLADGAKASHLTYIGDAEIGRNVNLGCGFITCNYDGFKKHRTIVEDDVFVGSDCQAVAPVRLGKGSYVAAGSTVTQDVPPDALAISRGRQVNKEGLAARLRNKKKTS